ncbi:MAG: T9SS type A sorting domain-containing protein, partial [Bacteroidota bacterium]
FRKMRKCLLLLCLLSNSLLWAQTEIAEPISGTGYGDYIGGSFAINVDGSRFVVHSNRILQQSIQGRLLTYDWNGFEWETTTPSIDGMLNEIYYHTGFDLSEDGHRLVAPYAKDGIYSLHRGFYTFEWTNEEWLLIDSTESPATDEQFADKLKLSEDGNFLICSSYGYTTKFHDYPGVIRVYQWNGTSWQQRGSQIEEEQVNAGFGHAVDISADGNRIVFSANLFDGDIYSQGRVYTYEWDGIDWIPMSPLFEGQQEVAQLGTSVELSREGNQLTIGTAQGGPDFMVGLVQNYLWQNGSWEPMGQDININPYGGHDVEVSLSGNRILIAAPAYGSNLGNTPRVLAYDWDGETWNLSGIIDHDNYYSRWAHKIGLSGNGDRLLIGEAHYGSQDFGRVYSYGLSTLNTQPKPQQTYSLHPTIVVEELTIPPGLSFESLEIYDANGRFVLSQQNTSRIIDTSSLPSGYYILVLNDPNHPHVFRFIKQ